MERRPEEVVRDRAIWIVRLATFGSVASALGLTWLFSNMAEAYFSGKSVPPPTPHVPNLATPVQSPPVVITTTVHHPYSGPAPAPRPPSGSGRAAPAPPPPPVCHSTPSKPC